MSINLNSKTSSYTIHSYNKKWFIGMKEELKTFFHKNKSWYSTIYPIFPILNGLLMGIFFTLILESFKLENYFFRERLNFHLGYPFFKLYNFTP